MENDDLDVAQEPDILPLWRYERPKPPDHDDQPEGPDCEGDTRSESFWAGRNHAMRHSARWAA
jgi:hypothetical protein